MVFVLMFVVSFIFRLEFIEVFFMECSMGYVVINIILCVCKLKVMEFEIVL